MSRELIIALAGFWAVCIVSFVALIVTAPEIKNHD